MQLATKVIRKLAIIVMNAEIGRTYIAHSQLLLLISRCWDGVAIISLE
jgi:hypothetical protein